MENDRGYEKGGEGRESSDVKHDLWRGKMKNMRESKEDPVVKLICEQRINAYNRKEFDCGEDN